MAFDSPPALYYHQDNGNNSSSDDSRSCGDVNGCVRSGEKEGNENAPPVQTQSSPAPVAVVTHSVPAVQAAVARDISYLTAGTANFYSRVAPLSGTSHRCSPARSKDVAELRSEVIELIFAIRGCNEKIALIEAQSAHANAGENADENSGAKMRAGHAQEIAAHRIRLAEIASISPVLAGFIHKKESLTQPRSEIQQRIALVRTRVNLQFQLDDGLVPRKEWAKVQKQIDDIGRTLAEDSGTAVFQREQSRMPHERAKRLRYLLQVSRNVVGGRGQSAESELSELLASHKRIREAQKRERDRRDDMRDKKAWPLDVPRADEKDRFAEEVGGLSWQEVSEMELGIKQAEYATADHIYRTLECIREDRIDEEMVHLEKAVEAAYVRGEDPFEPAWRVEYRAREPGWHAEDEPLPGDPFDVDLTDLAAVRQYVVRDLAAISTGRKPPWKLPDINLNDPATVREAMREILEEAPKRAA